MEKIKIKSKDVEAKETEALAKEVQKELAKEDNKDFKASGKKIQIKHG